jgi:hypothetical protein
MAGPRRGGRKQPTSFDLQPELQFVYFLCEQLGKLPSEVESMDVMQFHWMAQYFQQKYENEKRAQEDAKRRI